ncbi:MAG: hypothetical protein JO112_14710 [Planctomycetes bacterium]|nr:hypothetical protein [Planctomycetota bacterium]
MRRVKPPPSSLTQTLGTAGPSSGNDKDVVLSNLAQPDQVEFSVSFSANETKYVVANSFTTSLQYYVLSSATLALFSNSGGAAELQLRTDRGGVPGPLIGSLGSQAFASGANLVTYSSVGFILLPNTTYWLTLGQPGATGDVAWSGTFSATQTSPVGWSIGDRAFFSEDGGVTYQEENAGPPSETARFSISARILPE